MKKKIIISSIIALILIAGGFFSYQAFGNYQAKQKEDKFLATKKKETKVKKDKEDSKNTKEIDTELEEFYKVGGYYEHSEVRDKIYDLPDETQDKYLTKLEKATSASKLLESFDKFVGKDYMIIYPEMEEKYQETIEEYASQDKDVQEKIKDNYEQFSKAHDYIESKKGLIHPAFNTVCERKQDEIVQMNEDINDLNLEINYFGLLTYDEMLNTRIKFLNVKEYNDLPNAVKEKVEEFYAYLDSYGEPDAPQLSTNYTFINNAEAENIYTIKCESLYIALDESGSRLCAVNEKYTTTDRFVRSYRDAFMDEDLFSNYQGTEKDNYRWHDLYNFYEESSDFYIEEGIILLTNNN